MQVRLAREKVWEWQRGDGLFVKGFAFNAGGEFLKDKELFNWIDSQVLSDDFNINVLKKIFQNLNGFFAVVLQRQGRTFCVVDKVRAFPLFYRTKGEEVAVTDDPLALLSRSLTDIQPHIRHQFLQSGFVAGAATLADDIQQVMAGCIAEIDEASGAVRQHAYFQHLHGDYFPEGRQALLARLDETADAVFQRLVQSVDGRPVAVPLSGGYDSRFVASMLKKLDYKPVVCYTYGRENSFEVKRARQVAQRLGFPWVFVRHDKSAFQSLFGEAGAAYRRFSTDGASMPHDQDFFALHRLQHTDFPKDAVIVPGFCGDLLAGSFMLSAQRHRQLDYSVGGLADFITTDHFHTAHNDPYFVAIRSQVLQELLQEFSITNPQEFQSVHEHWITTNRVAKYTVNANRITEFFGHEWRMPLWDDAWMRLWYSIPNSPRVDQALYRHFLDERLFGPFGIRIAGKTFDERQRQEGLIPFIKAQLPGKARKLLKPLFIPSRVADPNNFALLAKMIGKRLSTPLKSTERKDINYVHARWHLQELEGDSRA